MMKILNETEVIRHIQQSGDSKKLQDFLAKGYDFKPSMVDTRYNFRFKFRYDCGNFLRVFSLSILINQSIYSSCWDSKKVFCW